MRPYRNCDDGHGARSDHGSAPAQQGCTTPSDCYTSGLFIGLENTPQWGYKIKVILEIPVTPTKRTLLLDLAEKYIWWKTPDDAVAMPERVMAQVMNIGAYDDVQILVKAVGRDALRKVIEHAEIGQFNERSWAYWHYRLGLATLGKLPPMPQRRFA